MASAKMYLSLTPAGWLHLRKQLLPADMTTRRVCHLSAEQKEYRAVTGSCFISPWFRLLAFARVDTFHFAFFRTQHDGREEQQQQQEIRPVKRHEQPFRPSFNPFYRQRINNSTNWFHLLLPFLHSFYLCPVFFSISPILPGSNLNFSSKLCPFAFYGIFTISVMGDNDADLTFNFFSICPHLPYISLHCNLIVSIESGTAVFRGTTSVFLPKFSVECSHGLQGLRRITFFQTV